MYDYNNIVSDYINNGLSYERITEIGEGLRNGLIEPAYITPLIRLIINDTMEAKRYKNKFAEFKKPRTSYSGKIINSTYVNPATGENIDLSSKTDVTSLFDYAPADVKSALTRVVKNPQYKVTYQKDELYKAFTSPEALQSFINNLVNSLINGSEINDRNEFVSLLGGLYSNNQAIIKTATKPTDLQTTREFAILLKEYVFNLQDASDKYNVWKKINPNDTSAVFWSNMRDLNILMPSSIYARMEVDLFAQLFNVERAEVDARVHVVSDELLPSGVFCILFDASVVDIRERFNDLEMPFYDPTKRTYLQVLNTSTEYGIIPFANCVVFAESIPSIVPTAVRSMTVNTAVSSTITTGILVNPVGANATITVEASDAGTTPTISYDETLGYQLKLVTTSAAQSGTVTFKYNNAEIGKINVNIA